MSILRFLVQSIDPFFWYAGITAEPDTFTAGGGLVQLDGVRVPGRDTWQSSGLPAQPTVAGA